MSSDEAKLLVLLTELQSLLSEAINSLDTKSMTAEARYLAICAITVNQASSGYLTLRKLQNIYPSKFLIRPILEATLYANAAIKKRGFLFRKAYTELLEEKKFFRQLPEAEADFNSIITQLEAFFKQQDPHYPIERKKVDLASTATWAEMNSLYEVGYRTYCSFTHGSINAALGSLNEVTDDLDTRIVAGLVFMMLEQLQANTQAKIPDLRLFRTRLENQ